MNIKTRILAILAILAPVAPVGCDEAPEQNELALDVVPGLSLADLMDLDLIVDEAPSAARVHGEFELMSAPDHSFGKTLCCGHGYFTWDCSGNNEKGEALVDKCEDSPYCSPGACLFDSGDVPLDPLVSIDTQLPGDQV